MSTETKGAGGMDWPGLMRVGIGGLRLSPADFWRLTPAELALMVGDPVGVRPMDRCGFDRLRQAWPDDGRKHRDDGRE